MVNRHKTEQRTRERKKHVQKEFDFGCQRITKDWEMTFVQMILILSAEKKLHIANCDALYKQCDY